jgi:excinuclease ABC subunit A
MSVSEALILLENVPSMRHPLEVLQEVGLGYLVLGQSALTLSGGESQRVKLASELSLRSSEPALFILDEPTTGLHFDDISKLLHILQRLADAGHTIVLIEHHLDVIKSVDYVIDLGPGGGDEGGKVMAVGLPEEVAAAELSVTGRFLRKSLAHSEPAGC